MHGRSLLILCGIVFGLGSLYFALRGADIGEVIHIVREHAHWSSMPLFLLAYAIFFWLKSMRWALLLRPHRRVGSGALLPITVVGYAANVLFPMQLGELARAYFAGRKLQSDAAPLLTSIALERVFDLLAVILGLGIVLPMLDGESDAITMAAHVVGVLAGFGLLGLGFYVWRTATVLRWVQLLMTHFPERTRTWVLSQLRKGAAGVNALREAHLLGAIALLSIAMWSVMSACCLIALRTVDIDAGPTAAFFTLFMSVVGIALPTAPGFIGTIQIAFVLALVPFGVGRDQALAASIYYHALITVPPLLVAGAILLNGAVREPLAQVPTPED